MYVVMIQGRGRYFRSSEPVKGGTPLEQFWPVPRGKDFKARLNARQRWYMELERYTPDLTAYDPILAYLQ